MASGAVNVRFEVPVGVPTSVSSATRSVVVSSLRRSSSVANTRTGMIGGSGPTRPATALRASSVSVPTSRTGPASLYVPPESWSCSGLLTMVET